MKVVLAGSMLLSGASVIGQATGLPPWLVLAGGILGSGGFVGRWAYLRLEQKFEQRLQNATAASQEATAKQTTASTAKLMEDVQTSILTRARAEHAEMQVEIEGLKTRLAEASTRAAQAEALAASKETQIAKLNNKVHLLSSRIESMHDAMTAMQLGEQFGKRRLDDEPEAP